MQITAAAGPTENRITTGIRYANAGMICIASSAGVIVRCTRALRPAQMPIGTPTRSESATAASISASVWMLGSHSPISANERNAARTISAARQPPKRSTISVAAAVTPSQVIHSSASVNARTSHSATARNASRMEKMKFGSVAERCSISQPWKSSSSFGSADHTSDCGHGKSPRATTKQSSMRTTTPSTCTGRLLHRCEAAGSAGAATPLATATLVLAGATAHRLEHRHAVDDPDHAAAVHCAHGVVGRDHRDRVLDRRGDRRAPGPW